MTACEPRPTLPTIELYFYDELDDASSARVSKRTCVGCAACRQRLDDLRAHPPSARRRVNGVDAPPAGDWSGFMRPSGRGAAVESAPLDGTSIATAAGARTGCRHARGPARDTAWVRDGGGDCRACSSSSPRAASCGAAPAVVPPAPLVASRAPGRRPRAYRRLIVGAGRRRAERASTSSGRSSWSSDWSRATPSTRAPRIGSTSASSPDRCSRIRGSIASPPRIAASRTSRT